MQSLCIMEAALNFGKSLVDKNIPYTKWDGEFPCSFYVDGVPSIKVLQEQGVNCAGLVNILIQYSGKSIPKEVCINNIPIDPRGGTKFWFQYFKNMGYLEEFDYAKQYPLGTLLLRDYRDIEDQGHCAILIEHYKDPSKTLYGKILHSYMPSKVGITSCGSSHFYQEYSHIVLPQNWL